MRRRRVRCLSASLRPPHGGRRVGAGLRHARTGRDAVAPLPLPSSPYTQYSILDTPLPSGPRVLWSSCPRFRPVSPCHHAHMPPRGFAALTFAQELRSDLHLCTVSCSLVHRASEPPGLQHLPRAPVSTQWGLTSFGILNVSDPVCAPSRPPATLTLPPRSSTSPAPYSIRRPYRRNPNGPG